MEEDMKHDLQTEYPLEKLISLYIVQISLHERQQE